MHITPFGEKNFPLDYFVGHKHGRMLSCQNKTLNCVVLYCMYKYIKMCKDVIVNKILLKPKTLGTFHSYHCFSREASVSFGKKGWQLSCYGCH